MNKCIFWGPQDEFRKEYNFDDKMYFSELIRIVQKEEKTFEIKGVNQETLNEIGGIKHLIINSDEYSMVNEWVLYNLDGFISKFEIENVYFQNPPSYVYNKLLTQGDFQEKIFEYKNVDKEIVKEIYNEFSNTIIGQDNVKEKLSNLLYASTFKFFNEKPLVIMFFGPSGVGKTETAKFISNKMGGKLFRKQFSMFQNNEFANYLFGTKHNEGSFARDLLNRETNVILLDEFDKANKLFFSAFYQLFDEGIFEDKNYSVAMKNAIIICTSNYESIKDIKENLGLPIYNRFDGFIEFSNLDSESCKKILSKDFKKYIGYLENDELEIIKEKKVKELLDNFSGKFNNAREIDRIVRDVIIKILSENYLKE